ncbi:hypothetical protein PRUPE_1G075000 [Prunus persica]|uniref:Uncharacterized protein n=1 Tax=Prunus persica TaxID=3760 RepID=A0A251QTS4_PRUPE|nr:hypothetical protein PRUPE_1G075000 [Prunus persica]
MGPLAQIQLPNRWQEEAITGQQLHNFIHRYQEWVHSLLFHNLLHQTKARQQKPSKEDLSLQQKEEHHGEFELGLGSSFQCFVLGFGKFILIYYVRTCSRLMSSMWCIGFLSTDVVQWFFEDSVL